ncbi:MAG: GAF domain-containing protein [Alphaproteobacteria bacterium]|nr:GAF domain-containing protein [Alphaproteobacteria bacterium]
MLFPQSAICVTLPENGRVQLAALADADSDRAMSLRARFPMPLTREGMHGAAILDGRQFNISDAADTGPFPEELRNLLADGYRAITIMPMIHSGIAVGAISLLRRAPGWLSTRQVALLETFSNQAVIAFENARLFAETKEALEQQTAISEILRILSSSPGNMQPVLDAVAERAALICNARFVDIILVQDGRSIHVAASFGRMQRPFEPVPLDRETVMGRSILERTPLQVADLQNAGDEYPAGQQLAVKFGHRTILSMPLVRDDRALGAIVLRRAEDRPFEDKHIALLKTFADQAAISIDNARLINEIREALEQQTASGEILRVISGSMADTAPVFDKILESCERLFVGRIVGLNLVRDDGKLHIGAYHGAHRQEFERIFPIDVSPNSGSGLAIVEQRIVHYPDTEHEDVPDKTRRGCRAIGAKSAIFAPILREGRGLGAIFVARDRVSHFSDQEIALLKTFADEAAIAIENVRLFNEIQEKSQQLEAASRHKSEFLANMSHELRTPLNAIIGFTRIVMRRCHDRIEALQYENLEKILSSGQHLLALINSVLDLSKIEAGRIDVRPSELTLGPVLEQCLRTVEPLIRAEAVKLVSEFAPGLPRIFADEEKLRQIVINLLSNAAKFTDQGTICLHARAANGSVAIAVVDTGAGIPADKLEAIFEEFEQVDSSSTRVHGGTGLGLAIARRLARLMGGDISADSVRGQGSTFTLALPVSYRPPET